MISPRALSRWLLLIVTLTILSPHFAWEVMAADAHHDPVTGAVTMFDTHEHPNGNSGLDHHDEHACGGHMFSHLPVQASATATSLVGASSEALAVADAAPLPSHHPELPDRPPRRAAL